MPLKQVDLTSLGKIGRENGSASQNRKAYNLLGGGGGGAELTGMKQCINFGKYEMDQEA